MIFTAGDIRVYHDQFRSVHLKVQSLVSQEMVMERYIGSLPLVLRWMYGERTPRICPKPWPKLSTTMHSWPDCQARARRAKGKTQDQQDSAR